MKRVPTMGVLLAIIATSTPASTPASAEEILCFHKTLVEIVVVDARSHDCASGMCSPRVGVTGRIERVIGPSLVTLHDGETISASFYVLKGKPMLIGNEWFPMNKSNRSQLGWPVTEGAITNKAAKVELVGKRLYLAVTPSAELKTGYGPEADARYHAELGEPYHGAVYEPAESQWLKDTWASCRGAERG